MGVNINKIKIGSMFCGMGGFDTGLSNIGFVTVWSIDIMTEACKSFKANFPNVNVLNKDVHAIKDFKALGEVKGIIFGPPCQGFSRANARRSMDDPRNYSYLATLKALEQLECEFFIFENVIGLLDMTFDDGSSVFNKIKSDYESCGKGYTVSYQVIDCATIGIPQLNRFRLIMVGFRKDLKHKYVFSKTSYGKDKLPYVTQREVIGHLYNLDQTGLYYDGPYDWKFLSRKRQKSWDEPAYTVEASARYSKIHPGYGKMKWVSDNIWCVPDECRRLSVIESKLLQTFPEEYIVCGNLSAQYTQIGNAVPPKLAEYIGRPIAYHYLIKNKGNDRYYTEKAWLIEQIKKYPNNQFYRGLLNWILSGKQLTDKQRKYIAV